MREQEEIPVSLFWHYYKEMIAVPMEESQFIEAFNLFLGNVNGRNIITPSGPKYIELGNMYNKVCNYFNQKLC